MTLKLGCIADDFTGATDLANNLARAGFRVLQMNGVPVTPLALDVDAVVVALKSRTTPISEAVAESLAALAWLRAQSAPQVYFKYCSTFDSWYAPERFGNIGPVTEALMAALGADFTIATPAFPDNGRTVFKGHLFVGDTLLSDSSMKSHPLTPMNESNLVTLMQAQCVRKVGLIDFRVVAAGETAIRARALQLKKEGVSIAIVDAISNADLMTIGRACSDLALVTAGSGVAIGLPQNHQQQPHPSAVKLPAARGRRAIISGSCSSATNRQVAHAIANGVPAFKIDAAQLANGDNVIEKALQWAQVQSAAIILLYSTANAESVLAIQAQMGSAKAGELIERALGQIARGLVDQGVAQLIVAGGETSGACVQALGVTQMQIGPQIDPGVPWCYAVSDGLPLHLALKSGNFGTDDFFTKAFTLL